VIGALRGGLQCFAEKEGTMSLRSLAALAVLILSQLSACATNGKPSDPSINEMERRHDEMMQRMGGGSGGGSGM
jgi:hypothetical protein